VCVCVCVCLWYVVVCAGGEVVFSVLTPGLSYSEFSFSLAGPESDTVFSLSNAPNGPKFGYQYSEELAPGCRRPKQVAACVFGGVWCVVCVFCVVCVCSFSLSLSLSLSLYLSSSLPLFLSSSLSLLLLLFLSLALALSSSSREGRRGADVALMVSMWWC